MVFAIAVATIVSIPVRPGGIPDEYRNDDYHRYGNVSIPVRPGGIPDSPIFKLLQIKELSSRFVEPTSFLLGEHQI